MIQKFVRYFLVLVLAASAITASGQSLFRQGTSSLLVNDSTNSWDAFEGIAVDTAGNIYVTECGTSGTDAYSDICKETLQPDGTYVESVLFSKAAYGFYNPNSIVVDKSGNIYIGDSNNSRVLKETPSGSTYTQSIVTDYHNGLIFSAQIAVDTSGNVYVTDFNNKCVYKETLFGTTYTQSKVGTGFSYPAAVAVDAAGNVYIGDSTQGIIYKETLSGGTYTQTSAVTGLSNGIESIAIDGNSVLYATTAGSSISVYVPTATGYIANSQNLLPVKNGWAVTVDSTNNIYASGNSYQVTKFNLTPAIIPAVAVGSTSAVVTIPVFSISSYSGNTSGSKVVGAGVSLGASGEFTETGAGTCDTNGLHTYAAGETCTLTVTFSPKAAGIRSGAVELVNSSNVSIATVYLSAVGTAPQVAFSSGPQTTVTSSLVMPKGVAVNGNGLVYVADPGSPGVVYAETPSGSTYTQSTVLNFGAGSPIAPNATASGVTVDGAGTLYISNSLNDPTVGNYVKGIEYYNNYMWANVQLASPQLGNALLMPTSLAADPNGNIYVADTGNNRVVEEYWIAGVTFSTYFEPQLVVASGLSVPTAVAADASGNVYIADTGNNRILLEKPTSLGAFTQSVLFSTGISAPAGVAVDGFGNVFVSDTGNKRVLMELLHGATYTQSVIPVTGLVSPQGLAVDANESLFITDSGTGSVYKIALGTGPTLSFASTNVGSTSTDSPQTVTFSNIGNAALTFPIPGTGTNPSVSTGFNVSTTGATACPALSTSSGSAATLAAATSCTLPISFTPTTSGSISGTVKSTDNALNVSGTVQTINLNGTGVALSAPDASLSPTSIAFGNQTVNVKSAATNITLSNTGTAALTGIAISFTGTNPTAFAQTTTCGTTLAAGSNCTISVTFTPTSVAGFAATLSVADNSSGSPQTATLTGTGIAAPAPQATLSPTSLTFANQTTGTNSTSQPITLSNPGTAALTISSIAITGTNTSSFSQTNNCGTSLAVGASCTVSVVFTPQTSAALSAAVTVTDNASVTTQTTALSGTGIAPLVPQAVLSPTSLTFASQLVGTTSASQPVTLSNPGIATLTISNIAITGGSVYAETTTCGASLAAGASCILSVTFTPTTTGAATATLNVTDNATGSPQSVSLSGTGTSPASFALTATPAVQSVDPGGSASYTINIASTGGSFTSGVTLGVTGLPAGLSATFSVASPTPGTAGTASILTIQTPAKYASQMKRQGAPLLALLVLSPLLYWKRRRRLIGLSLASLLLIASLGLTSCAGGYFGPAPQSYNLTVTGTSNSIQQSTNITLNVQ